MRAVPARLAATPGLGPFLDELAGLGPGPVPLVLPSPTDAADRLARLGVAGDDAAAIVAALPSAASDPDRWWVLERAHHRLTAGLADGADDTAEGRAEPAPDGRGPWGAWPTLPPTLGPGWEWFHVHLWLAAVPDVVQWHEARGIAPEVTWATLANVGRNVGIHRAVHGGPGLDAPWWLVLHVRGALFELGRLQFRRARATWSLPEAPFVTGDPVLDVHIPPTGPLTPEAVDLSFLSARAFFGRHFPADDSPWGVCTSWLLDPQLLVYLPDDANIARFQRRFQVDEGWSIADDGSIIRFVFRRSGTAVDDLPRRTTLERAVVDHIRAGGHWQMRRGWCAVPPPALA